MADNEEILDMQLAIDENFYTTKRHAELIGEIHDMSKENSAGIKILTDIIVPHVAKEEAQDIRQKKMHESIKELSEKVVPLDKERQDEMAIKEYKRRVKNQILLFFTISAGFIGLITLWSKIKGWF